jgi:predicted ATPase/DNA-binding XRE family transcriptional regulator
MVTQETFGSLVRRFRRSAELTQEALAERAGLSVRAIRAIEAGSKHRPRHDTLQLLLGALAIPEEEQADFLRAARELGRPRAESRSAAPAGAEPDLPGDPTPFIGREEEIAAVVGLLDREPVRLVTLTGPGGTGKTRLAVEAARRLATVFPDGVGFVNLAPLASSDLVAPTIAAALQLPKSPAAPLDRLIARLRAARFLLVLDNFEHLLDAATIVSDLLAACPQLRVVATSREALRLRPEYEYPVPPMALPPQASEPRRLDPAEIEEYDSVAFFADRAGAVRPDFSLSAENADAVAAICRRLDGIPLALELAAARLRLFTPERLLERLNRRLAILTDGPRDLPTRQQTLRAAIDWSYDLLGESERTLLARLSVFASGWTVEAAEAVCSMDGDLDVLAGLGSLAEKRLIRLEDSGRFTMLETLREYAGERLAERADQADVRERHALWIAGVVGEEEPGPAARPAWQRLLDLEVDNLRAALDWARDEGHPELGLRLLLSSSRYWTMRGWVTERQRRLEAMLAADGHVDARTRAWGLALAGGSILGPGPAMLEEALALARELHDTRLEAQCLGALAGEALRAGDLERAEALDEEALRIAGELGDPQEVGSHVDMLALIALERGDLARASALGERALQLALEARDPHHATITLSNLAGIALRGHDLSGARKYLHDALVQAGPAGYEGAPVYLVEIGCGVAVAWGQLELGAELLGAAQTAREQLGWSPNREEQVAIDEATRSGVEALGRAAWGRAVDAGRLLTPIDCAALITAFCDDRLGAWADGVAERAARAGWERA